MSNDRTIVVLAGPLSHGVAELLATERWTVRTFADVDQFAGETADADLLIVDTQHNDLADTSPHLAHGKGVIDCETGEDESSRVDCRRSHIKPRQYHTIPASSRP